MKSYRNLKTFMNFMQAATAQQPLQPPPSSFLLLLLLLFLLKWYVQLAQAGLTLRFWLLDYAEC